MRRLGQAATAAAVMTLATVSGCANSAPATTPSFIVTDTSTTTSTTVPVVNLAWLDTTTTTVVPVVPVVPETVRNTGTPVDGCFVDLARSIGWPEETLGTLARIIERESRCDPTSYADRPSTFDNSRGLLQINAYGTLADGVRDLCGITDLNALFDPATNLACGLTYWRSMGWRPWGGA